MNKTLRNLFLYNGVFVLAGSLLGPLYAIYVQKIQNSPEVISYSWATFLISSIFFMTIIAKLGDSFGCKKFLLVGGFLVRALVWVLYIFVDTISSLLLLQILLGFGEALGGPAYNAMVAEHLDRKEHMKDYSDQILFFSVMSAVGTIAGGFLISRFDFQIIFLAMAALALVSAIGILMKIKNI